MDSQSLKEIKTELNLYPKFKLEELIIQLLKFRKENKELISYLLFEATDENRYVRNVKLQMDAEFNKINLSSFFLAKKTIRKVLRTANKFIKYSKDKSTEVELLIHFCNLINQSGVNFHNSPALENLYQRQLAKINKAINGLHEDLQFDYRALMEELKL